MSTQGSSDRHDTPQHPLLQHVSFLESEKEHLKDKFLISLKSDCFILEGGPCCQCRGHWFDPWSGN